MPFVPVTGPRILPHCKVSSVKRFVAGDPLQARFKAVQIYPDICRPFPASLNLWRVRRAPRHTGFSFAWVDALAPKTRYPLDHGAKFARVVPGVNAAVGA